MKKLIGLILALALCVCGVMPISRLSFCAPLFSTSSSTVAFSTWTL